MQIKTNGKNLFIFYDRKEVAGKKFPKNKVLRYIKIFVAVPLEGINLSFHFFLITKASLHPMVLLNPLLPELFFS